MKTPSHKLFFGALILMAVASGINDSILNNFLADTFSVSAAGRGWIELPREFPGLMVVLTTGLLAALPVTRLGAVGAGIFAAGLLGLAVIGWSFVPMIAMMVLASTGQHILQPVDSSLAIGMAAQGERGRGMGHMGAVGTVGTVIGAGAVWLAFGWAGPRYPAAFGCAAVLAAVGMLLYARLHVPLLQRPRPRLVLRRKFGLYYVLEFLFGARKQIFLTFGPWVLIKVYHQPAASIAGLLMVAAVIGIGFRPLVGRAIDRFGERAVLMMDGAVLVLVCLGYGYAAELTGSAEAGRVLACTCLVLDNLLFALGTGRAVYASHLAADPQELTSTLAMGISINHFVSMLIPILAGSVWVGFGYQRVFLAAAFLALANALVSARLPRRAAAAVARA